jgi:hypothetical protein
MIANWYYDEIWSCCRVGDAHSTNPCQLFSRLLYNFFFLTPSLNPNGYFTFLIMKQNVPFSPNLYTNAWHFLRNDLHDLRLKCKLAFPSAGDFTGDGSTITNIKMNTK